MVKYPGAAALAAGVLLSVARPLAAQTDYRNLDHDRPVAIDDAFPVEHRAVELGLALRHAARRFDLIPEVAAGLLPNTMLGVALPVTEVGAGNQWGLAGIRGFALYNLTGETRVLPALALRLDGSVPVVAGDAARGSVKLIASRSWGLTRLHVNGAAGFGRGTPVAAEALPLWRAGAAVDRTILRRSILVLAGVTARRETRGTPVQVNGALGVRFQQTPTIVLDLALAWGLRGHDRLGVNVGVTRTMAVAGPIPRRSAPTSAPPRANRSEAMYYPGRFNWKFLARYPDAARLFNAFDYGHAVLYERLLQAGDSATTTHALDREFGFLTQTLLVDPPRFAIAEEAVAPGYAREAREAMQMFDWAHVLHRQIYDAYADDRLTAGAKDSLIERLTDVYLGRADLAFATVPKAMALMDGQYFSQVFRRRHPTFNGLIWAYHWLQVGLYDPLLGGATPEERRRGVQATVARFRAMIANPPANLPATMPMTSVVAPRFTARHPRAAAVFDNLHMMHDIISDILASDAVPRAAKGRAIREALREFKDGTRNLMPIEEWLRMGETHRH